MQFGFSYVGLIFLVMLMVPNLLWTKHQPKDYQKFASRESRLLLALERAGEVSVACALLIFKDFNVHGLSARLIWLIAAFALMILYEVYWVRYFKSGQTMQDFYRSLLGIPVPGAVLPVAAFALLAVYGRNPVLLAADIILGVGHIGIHLRHWKQLRAEVGRASASRDQTV